MPPKSVKAKILPRRFELIKKMYISDKVIAANKKDLIFNWFFEQFGCFQNKSSSYTYELLWKTFCEILEIEKNQNSRHRILIKSNAVMNLVNTLTNFPFSNSWSSLILSTITTFLQTPTVNAALIADIEKLFLLLIGSLKVICKIQEDNSSDVVTRKEAENLANSVLDILENLPASNDEQKALLLADYLQDLAVFMHFASSDPQLHHLSEKLARKIISIIFNLKTKKFETLITPTKKTTVVERPNPDILKFFTSLHRLLMNEGIMHYSVPLNIASGTLIGKLLSAFMNQNKSSLHSLKVVSLLFAIAGLDIPIIITATSCCKSLFKGNTSNVNLPISAISHLLEACSTVPQYFTSVAVPDEYLRSSIWLKGVSAALLDLKISKNKTSWLKCFCSLFIISPTFIENEIVQLIKVALLNISVNSKESEKQYCELFSIVLQTHSKLHQAPKFFVKLLLAVIECMKEDSSGPFLKNGQILPAVLESVAKCVQELPYGQMIELWKVFIETFSTLENMSQAFNVSKGFIFFVAQLFSTFLLHAQLFQANIPSNINSQFSTLIESTCNEIKKNISALKETNYKVVPLQSSILQLCYAVGEVKFLYNANLGDLPDTAKLPLSDEVFDFSIIHSYLDQTYSAVLESFMKSEEKILSYLVFQLMLQKIRVLDFCSKFSNSTEPTSEKRTNLLQSTIFVILQYLQESSTASESWDLDICTINAKNYGSAFWMSFLKISRLVLHHLQPKDVYNFCSSLQDIILENNGCEFGAKSVILSSLTNGDFEDFKHFQTAFISSIWRQTNLLHTKKRSHDDMESEETLLDRIFTLLNGFKKKSLKYAQRTPKSDKNLGSMWSEIKEIADHLNNILLSESLPKEKLITKKVFEAIKLLNTLPLQYLLPGNQMKSIMGLSLIFFLIPQSCNENEALVLSKEIFQLLLNIFEGARSIWLFDFVTSGPYLKFVVKTIESVLSNKLNDNHDWADRLLEHLITLAVKNVESLNGLENFISKIATKSKCKQSVLIILCALMKKLSRVLSHPHKQEKYQETLIKVSLITLQATIEQMKRNFIEQIENTYQYYFIKCYMQAIEMTCSCSDLEKLNKDCCELLPAVLEKAFNIASSSNVDILSDVYLLFISKICKYSPKLSAYLPKDFVSLSWKIVFSHFEERRKMKIEFFKANQKLKNSSPNPSKDIKNSCCVLCSAYKDSIPNIKSSRSQNDANCSNDKSFVSCRLTEFEEENLKELSMITPSDALNDIFLHLSKEIDCFNSNDIFSLQFSILICRCVIDADVEKCKEPLQNSFMQKFLSQLHYTINQACDSVICHTMVVIPILDFTNFIVKGNKGLPKHVLLQNLHSIATVPLEVKDGDYSLFVSLFNAVWKIVYDLFMHHTSVILGSPAPLLSYIAKLLKSIVRAGSSTSLCKCDTKTLQQMQLCGQNMDRLLTVISRNKNEFSKLVPYLVADYVDSVQHITLDSNLKVTILSGIYRLLDICSDQSIKMLSVNINYVCREIYTNLIKNFKQTKQMVA